METARDPLCDFGQIALSLRASLSSSERKNILFLSYVPLRSTRWRVCEHQALWGLKVSFNTCPFASSLKAAPCKKKKKSVFEGKKKQFNIL